MTNYETDIFFVQLYIFLNFSAPKLNFQNRILFLKVLTHPFSNIDKGAGCGLQQAGAPVGGALEPGNKEAQRKQ